MKIYTYDNKIMTVGGKWMEQPAPVLPPYTIRLKFTEGVTPTFSYGAGVQVSSSPNVWDLTYNNTSWLELLRYQTNLLEVIDGNTVGVTSMTSMFYNCTSLTSVSLFDTSSVTYMDSMFYNCTSLTSVPLFNTSSVQTMLRMFYACTSLTSVPLFNTANVTNMNDMFYNCTQVQSGALTLYNQASSQVTPPSRHSGTFTNCGRDTVTGAAELAQIPQDWGGEAYELN